MTVSAVARKSISDLTRRRGRAVFTVAALAIAVASIGLFALPTLMNRAMNKEIAANKLADVTITVNPLPLSSAQLQALRSLPNVAAFEPGSTFGTYVYEVSRTEVIGKASFSHQTVDAVTVSSGSAPGPGEVLSDVQNAAYGHDVGGTGSVVRLRTGTGRVVSLRISGEGRNLNGGQTVASQGIPVLYATAQTVVALRGTPGYTELAFRLHDPSTAAARQTVDTIRRYLQTVPGFTGFNDLPEIRSPGDWPGKSGFGQVTQIMSVITLLALLGALVLLSSTMTAMIGEQTPEIATMKAIGAGRKQIRRVYLRTATLLGALAAVVGAVLGILLAWALTSYFASSLYAISAPFSADLPVVVACIALGVIGPPLAALPAVRRAARLPLAETLQAAGSATGPEGRLDRLLRRGGWVRSLPRTAQIGLRSVSRRRRRSITTALQVSLAVATLLAFQSFATSVSDTVNQSWNSYRMNIEADSVTGQALPTSAQTLIASTAGVAHVQPALYNSVKLGGQDGTVWALPDKPMYSFHLVSGRLLTPADQTSQARVVVVEQAIARASGTHLGQRVTVRTAAGDVPFTVVGIVSDQQDSGTVLYVPLTTMQSVLHTPGAVNTYWIQTTSGNHQLIDQTNARIEHAVATHGLQMKTTREYVGQANDRAHYRTLTTVLTALGLLIVAISMVALINTLTMVVFERTREIGILRCIGAHARDVRRIFATEGLTIVLVGWLIGVPLGFGLAHGVLALVQNVVNQHLLFTFPALNIPIALIGTVILALLVMQIPLRRAVRFKPGEALRYA